MMSTHQVIKEANVNPSGPGKLEEIVKMDPPTFSFVVPLPPQVVLGDYKSIRKEYAAEPVTDEQVEATIRRLQRSYATAEPVQRPAQEGDLVSFKLSAKRTQPEEGQPEMLVEETPYQLVAGEENEDDEAASWPYEGFSKELVGLSENETKTFVHTFSDESPYEDLRGKEAEFNIVVQSVKEMHLPELTDEFAQTLGEFENVDALRKAVRAQLEQQSSQQYDQAYFDDLINTLVEQSTTKYPPHMLDEEIEDFLHGLEHNLERDHLDLETYLKMREMDRDTFIENEVKPAATRRLERSLVLEEFAHQENIEVKNEEVHSIYNMALQQLQQTQGSLKAPSRNRRSTQEMANSLAINTVNSIFNQRLSSRLKAIATGHGDDVEEAEVVEEQPEGEMQLPPVTEAGLESVEASPVMGEVEAEEEEAAGTEDALGAASAPGAPEAPQAETHESDETDESAG